MTVVSGVIFSLLHMPNAFFGQSVGGAAFQWRSPSLSA